MDELVRLTLYVTPELKNKLFDAAKKTRPKTSATRLGSHLLEIALQDLEESEKSQKEKAN
jgi:hypothetical protein